MIALTVESGNAVSDGVRNGSHAPAAGIEEAMRGEESIQR